MTRKDYIKIAEVLRETKAARDKLVLTAEFSIMLKYDNERFDQRKFYNAVFAFKAF